MQVDISFVESKSIRTLLRFLCFIFENEVKPSEQEVQDFIDNYIPEMRDYILNWTQSNLKALENLEFVSEATEKLKEKEREIVEKKGNENFDEVVDEIYRLKYPYQFDTVACNLCTLLIASDNLNNQNEYLFDCIELEQYGEAYKILSNKEEGLLLISNGVSNYIMDIFREEFDFRKHYLVVPDLYHCIGQQKWIQLNKEYLVKKKDHNCFLSDVLLFFELIIAKNKEDILKILMALICIFKSYEYSETIRNFAKTLIDILQEIMYCGEIHKVYIQMKELNKEIPVEKRGGRDATTRFSIIFSASNEDIFLLRIDLPHKGVNKLHINMQEKVAGKMIETGISYDAVENDKMIREIAGDDFDSLFFCINHHIWFRSEFLNKVDQLKADKDKKEKLFKLFRDRSHYSIDCNEGSEEQYDELVGELSGFLQRFRLSRNVLCSFDKNSLDMENEIYEVRRQQCILKELMECFKQSDNCSVDANVLLWEIFGAGKLQGCIDKAEFMKLDLSECWELIHRLV